MPFTGGIDDIYKCLSFGIKRRRTQKKQEDGCLTEGSQRPLVHLPESLSSSEDKPIASTMKQSEAQNVGENFDDGEDTLQILGNSTLKVKLGKRKKTLEEKVVLADKEQVTRLRKQNRIFTWGSDIPNPVRSFSEIEDISPDMLKNLSEFGISEPTAIQMQAIPIMLQKRAVLASAPTGSGKTLAFALPIILGIVRTKRSPKFQNKGRLTAVILEPTKELAKQTYVQFLKFGQGLPVKCALMEDKSLPDDVDIFVSTPNRVAFALSNSSFTDRLKKLKWLVVDESDRLFDTTEGDQRCFRNQLAKIYQSCNASKFVRHAFFSATFSYEVEEWCKENLHNLAMVCIGARNSAIDCVKQELVFAGSEQGKVVALRTLFHQGFEPPAIVFVQSKDRARQLFSEIEGFHPHIPAALISSDVEEKERDLAIAGFREGKVYVLVCTELMGRGLDFRGVNLVVNFDLPTSIVSYIHRIGRAGRAGRMGRAITYFTEGDLDMIRPVATVINQAGFPVPEYTLRLRKVSRKARKKLLRHAPKRKNIGVSKKLLKKKSIRPKKEMKARKLKQPSENSKQE